MKNLYLFAKEDIYDEYTHDVVYLKDELVGNLNLIKEGENQIMRGNYYLQESLNKDIVDIRVEERLEDYKYYENLFAVKQYVYLLLEVIDAYNNKSIEGVHLGIFAKEDIYDIQNNLVYHKDDFILDVISQKNNLCQVPLFNIDKGTFYIAQISDIEGYIDSKEEYVFHVDSSNIQEEIKITIQCFPTVIEVCKKDEEKKFIKGAWLAVYDEVGRMIDEWISEREHCVYGLKIGNIYVIKELATPKGYQKSKDIFFIVKKDKTFQKLDLISKRIED